MDPILEEDNKEEEVMVQPYDPSLFETGPQAEEVVEVQPYSPELFDPNREVEVQAYNPAMFGEPVEEISQGAKDFEEIQKIRQEYGRGFTQEDLVNDDRLFAIVQRDLMARSSEEGGFVQGAKDIATGITGGSTLSGWSKKSREEQVEMWQTHQRSFAGGQSVTTLNELTLVNVADEDRKRAFGAGYTLFDNMENIFTGDNVSWSDMFDGLRDYTSAALWDPTTIVGLGVGRALTAGGTKATATGIKMAAKAASRQAAKEVLEAGGKLTAAKVAARAAEQKVIKEGLQAVATQAAASASMKTGIKDFAAYGAVDFVSAIGTDVAYQNILIDTEAQEVYNYAQTGLSALGLFALPAAVYATKGAAKVVQKAADLKGGDTARLFKTYDDFTQQFVGLTPTQKTNKIRQSVKMDMVTTSLEDTFKKFKQHKSRFEPWTEAIKKARARFKDSTLKTEDWEVEELFWNTFLWGQPSKKSGMTPVLGLGQDPDLAVGFVQAMKDAGLVYVPRSNEDNVSAFLSDAMSWIPESTVKGLRDEFEAATGVKLDFLESPKTLADASRARASIAGTVLNQSSMASRLLSKGGKAAKEALEQVEEVSTGKPDWPHYIQSVWKRTMTSHFGTTMLNIKGWAATTALNSASDAVLGIMNFGIGAAKRVTGDTVGAETFFRAGKASMLGSMKRGYRVLNPNATKAEFDQLMVIVERAEKELTRELAGDSGAAGAQTAARFGFKGDEASVKGIEWTVDKLQALTFVKLQDEVTKQISFMSAFDQVLYKKYNKTFNELASEQGGLLKMQSPEFFDEVVAPAVDRALRETYSKSWTRQPGKSVSLRIAKTVESLSNDPIGGYLIPFGRFFNTSMATIGDYSGLNAARHLVKKVTGDEAGFAGESGLELLSKGIVGLGVIGYYSDFGMEKIQNGLSWNQELDSDGTIRDVTYDFPESMFHLFGQVWGHYRLDQEVPKDLASEAFEVAVGQTFRGAEDAFTEISNLFRTATELSIKDTGGAFVDVILAGMGRVASGLTRPLDPVNTAAMLMTDDYDTADRRQGVAWWNEATRYIDKIVPEEVLYGGERPKRYQPTRTTGFVDSGKAFGDRNLPEPTPVESMMNSVGARPWSEIRWDGPPEVKNRMDQLIAPYLNTFAQKALATYPDFFERPLSERQSILGEVVEKARKAAKTELEAGFQEDPYLNTIMQIYSLPNQTNVERVMKKLEIEGKPEDLINEPGGLEKLKIILYFSKEFDENFFLDKK